jgi:hypothetical protein
MGRALEGGVPSEVGGASAQKKAAAEAAVRAGVVVPFPLKLTWERLMNARHKSSLKTAPFTFQGLQAAQEEGK